MKSYFEPMNAQNLSDNINYETQNNSIKKFFSRNPINKANYFIDTNYISNQGISNSYQSLDKNKKENISNEKYSAKISNQFNNKKFTNNIINYCLINQNQNPNKQNQSENFFYNIEKDLLFNDEQNPFPKPEPTPLKIDKSTKYVNISKYFDMNNKNLENKRNNVDIKLVTFLQNLNLDNLLTIFQNNYINFKDLFLLTKEDYIEMKIPIGPRNKLIYYIEQYRKNMKNYEIEDILIFFKYNNAKNREIISSSFYSSYNYDYSNIKKVNNNCLFLSNSVTQRGFNSTNDKVRNVSNDIDIINNKLETSSRVNDSTNVKITNDKSISKIEKKDNYNIYNFKLNSNSISNIKRFNKNHSVMESKTIKNNNNHHQKKSINKSESFIFSNKFNNKPKKNKHNKNFFNIHFFNRKHSIKNNDFFYRNSMSRSNIQNISNNKSKKQKIYKKNNNLNTSKSINIFNNSFLNNQKKTINIKPKGNIKESKSFEIKENINENQFMENFRSLNCEVEKFENKYKRMKKDSCERKKKIKQLLMKNRVSSSTIKLLRHQLNQIDNINSQDFDISNNNINNKKENENGIHYKNNNINKTKKNFQNRKDKTFFYELNINNI